MSISTTAIQAYSNALADFQKAQTSLNRKHEEIAPAKPVSATSFSDTLHDSLNAVNDLQTKKSQMITSFASGETQNVHELMISMQKASTVVRLASRSRMRLNTFW